MARVRLTTIAAALCGALGLALPGVAAAGSVAGTVTASGGGGIAGVQVCFRPEPEAFETICAQTGADGSYKAENLPDANYVIRFDADRANLKYVSEYYNDAVSYFDLDVFHVGALDNVGGMNAELAEGGAIAGVVTDEATDLPVAGVRVCAEVFGGFPGRCVDTGSAGEYQVNGLPSDEYRVTFAGGNRVNYIREAYEDADPRGPGTPVAVVAPGVTAGIDAELARGGEILGRVTEGGTGLPRDRVFVCANEVDPGESQGCDLTDSNGEYAIRSLPGGTYLVAFEMEYMPFGLIAGQWWKGAATMAEATPIEIVPPATFTGIDGQLPPRFRSDPDPIQVSLIPRMNPKPKPRKCRKGFHKKKVKGKKRCVRKHKRHGKGGRKGGKRSVSR
ncbi:MAG TPA: carboxypeptidase-like regulatory domain-containing protein [Solirubrobacterales bacterium]|nr:carboxypeptidase-like regulatory domain-containing protein [Solirubrobacterales bacterium]